MNDDAKSFLQLAKELRKLGVVKVEGHGFTAVWVPGQQPQPQLAAARAPRPPKAFEDATKRAMPLTAEDQRELAYARELGKA